MEKVSSLYTLFSITDASSTIYLIQLFFDSQVENCSLVEISLHFYLKLKTSKSILCQFEKTAKIWLSSIDQYSEKQFIKKRDADTWSIGQVYNHLVNGSLHYQLQQVKQCLEGGKTERNGSKTIPGRLTFILQSFPPIRIKVPPSETYTPKQPENIEVMRTGLEKLIVKMQETEKKLTGADETRKTAHPAFGFLNAMEWFQLIEMHFRHHLRQKKRLDNFLASP